LEEALVSLSRQDYPNLSILVVAAGAAPSLAERVGACLPDAHFAQVDGTFAEAANKGMEMVKGAAHVLLCHDDVAFQPGAVRLLVEEAYRSNAGLTCPKLVSWEAPDRLVCVGMGADHLGIVHPLVDRGELDQGQHDAVREVFVAPAAAVLVRTDLWEALGGLWGSEGLDLSWRAQLAGARVVVAPRAVARHLEACRRDRDAEERDRFRALWACYSATTLLMVAPVAVAVAIAESLLALLRPPGRRAGGSPLPVAALAASLRAPGELRAARRKVQGLRRVSDLALWKAQSSGGTRFRAVLRRRAEQRSISLPGLPASVAPSHGAAAARAALPAPAGASAPAGSLVAPGGTRDKGDEIYGHDARAQRGTAYRGDKVGKDGWAGPVSREWEAAVAVALVALLLAGSRGLLSGGVPLIGQLPNAAGGVSSWWHAWWSGTGTAGLGSETFGPPGLLFMGLVGVVAFWSASVAAHLLVLVPLVIGPLGAYVGAGQFGSARGRLAAGVLYAALPVPYDAIATGHYAGLVSYAVAPWLLAGLCVLGQRHAPAWDWRRIAGMAVVAALAISLAPVMVVVVVAMGLALSAGSLLTGWPVAGSRGVAQLYALLSAAGAAVAAGMAGFVLLLPWSVRGLWAALGAPGDTHEGIGELLRFKTGPYGGGDFGWALLVAAAVSLLIGRGWRLGQAGRMWAVAFGFFALARAWSPAAGPEALLAPAGAALVYCVALGAASVEVDLSAYRFGWRQFVPAVGVAASLVAVLPFFSWAAGGRWGLAPTGAQAAYVFPAPGSEPYRVLWVGPPGTIPLASQGSCGGLSFAASLGSTPAASQLWQAPASRLAASVGRDLAWAQAGDTTELGHLLALAGVRYIAVPLEPRRVARADSSLLAALARQVDLSEVGIDPSYAVYANSSWLPVFFGLPPGTAANELSAAALAGDPVAAARAAQQFQAAPLSVSGIYRAGQRGVAYGAVPPGSWVLKHASRPMAASAGALGGTLWHPGPASGAGSAPSRAASSRAAGHVPSGNAGRVPPATLEPAGATGQHLAALATVLLWSACLVALFKRRRAGPGSGTQAVPRHSDTSPVGDELVLVGEER
jgi:GT2 family glycosyltransferase